MAAGGYGIRDKSAFGIETLNVILAQVATKDDVEALRVEVREAECCEIFGNRRLDYV